MMPRLNPYEPSPEAYQSLSALESYLSRCGLERSLIELVELRASQMNERAALSWTEAVTMVSATPVSDAVCEEALRHFSEKELVDLNWVVVAISAWNRCAIPFRALPGSYQPKAR